MSNAMRTGKRSLAALAVGALGAGLLTFVAAPSAQALASTISLSNPGVEVTKPASGAGTDDTTTFPLTVTLTNSAGTDVDLEAYETLTATVISWPNSTAVPAAPWVDDTSVGLSGSSTGVINGTTGAERNISSATATNGSAAAGVNRTGTGDYQFFIGAGGTGGWANTVAGDYVIRVSVTNNNTATSITTNFPVKVTATGVAPAATLTWVSDTSATNVVNAVSDDTGDLAGTFAYLRATNSAGWPILFGDDSITAAVTTGTYTQTATTTVNVLGGIGNVATNQGVYAMSNATLAFATGTHTLTATYTAPTAQTATLPIVIGSTASATATSVILTTTPATARSATTPNYQVPLGTRTLNFLATTATTSGSIAWQATSTGVGGEISPSSGIAAVTSTGTYSVTLTLNAAAAAPGAVITFTTGTVATTVLQAPLAASITASSPIVAKAGDPVIITGTLTDQFERPLAGVDVVSVVRTTPTASGLLDSQNVKDDGTWSLTIPAAAGPAAPANYSFTVTGTGGGLAAVTATVNVSYTATGAVTSISVTTTPPSGGGNVPAVSVPGTGLVNLANVSTAIANPGAIPAAAPTGTGAVTQLTFTSVPATTLSVSASEGVYLSTATTGTVNWNAGVNSTTVASGGTLTVWATKAGVNTITVKAGTTEATQQIVAFTDPTFARNVAITPAKVEVDQNTFASLVLKVTDVFSNPVRNVAVASVTAPANGVLLGAAGGGGIGTIGGTTNAAGEFTFAYTAPNAAGTALITAAGVGALTQFTSSITGAPAATSTATAEVTVRGAASRSIVIVGERTTVSGKSGILVEGVVTGIENGKTVKPFIRFPGQTTFTEGTARPEIQAGEFTWQRKTGKRVTVYVTSDDGAVKSNRVTIQAS